VAHDALQNEEGSATVHAAQHSRSSVVSRTPTWLWLTLIWAVLFSIGVTGYPDLLDNERRVAAYALDVLQN
jgi:hypothetical protein